MKRVFLGPYRRYSREVWRVTYRGARRRGLGAREALLMVTHTPRWRPTFYGWREFGRVVTA